MSTHLHIHKTIRVHADDDLVNVEMDPESEVAVSINISERGLSVVGWYHSHPHFQNNPSLVDVENQTRFQNFYKVIHRATNAYHAITIRA